MEKVKVGKRYQLVIPAAIRKKIKIKVGDEMLLDIIDPDVKTRFLDFKRHGVADLLSGL